MSRNTCVCVMAAAVLSLSSSAGRVVWAAGTWQTKVSDSPEDARAFLNGAAPYSVPVLEAKVSAYKDAGSEYLTFIYRAGSPGDPSPGWAWKVSYSTADAVNFLNGTGGYTSGPVTHSLICSLWTGTGPKLYIFYRRSGEAVQGVWNVAEKPSGVQVLSFLNGQGSVPKGRAQVTAFYDGSARHYYVFYKRPLAGQARWLWSMAYFSSATGVADHLNAPVTPKPLSDGKAVAGMRVGSSHEYAIFKPQGLLVVTRPMFEPTLISYALAGYPWVSWKLDMGFEVYLLSAEWIDLQSWFAGEDIRYKIRGWVQRYYRDRRVRFAMLVGDSIDEPTLNPPPNCLDASGDYAGSCPEPSSPTLSEAWNLPAGFHRWHFAQGLPQYTTLYYADAVYRTDNFYPQGKDKYDGSYVVNVGVVPARTTGHLANVLKKSMSYTPVTAFEEYYSSDLYTPGITDQMISQIASLGASATPPVTVGSEVFDSTSTKPQIVAAYLQTPNKVILGRAHGTVLSIVANGYQVHLSVDDFASYTTITPAYIASSCWVQAYMSGQSFNEQQLTNALGPAVVLSIPEHAALASDPTYPLATKHATFYQDLFNGATAGEAFYGIAHDAWSNPDIFFGDPSLVLFGPS